MLTRPHLIGPFESADRVWSGRYWPLYILLLLAVELHGGIGLYRLAVKWGWFAGSRRQRHAQAPEDAEVGAHRLLPGAGLRHARGLHQDRHRARAQVRASATCPTCAAAGAGSASNEDHLHRRTRHRRRARRACAWRIGAKRRGHDVDHPVAGAAQALALGGGAGRHAGHARQRDQGPGRQRGRALRGHGARQRLGRRPGRGADVRQHRAQGRARARRLGRAVEPRAQGRPRRHHQRPEGHDHRARRGARPGRAARLRRHQEVAHLLRLRRHRPRDAADDERPGDRRSRSRCTSAPRRSR